MQGEKQAQLPQLDFRVKLVEQLLLKSMGSTEAVCVPVPAVQAPSPEARHVHRIGLGDVRFIPSEPRRVCTVCITAEPSTRRRPQIECTVCHKAFCANPERNCLSLYELHELK
jgi:hypothetical protein